MPGLLGKKNRNDFRFQCRGKNVPCTVIEAGPCVVTQVKTIEKDGYKAVQLGFGEAKEKHTSNHNKDTLKRQGQHQRSTWPSSNLMRNITSVIPLL